MTINERIETIFVKDFYSPYELIKILNKEFNIDLPTQMAYNYCKKGMIKSSTSTTMKIQISKEQCIVWSSKYLTKKFVSTM